MIWSKFEFSSRHLSCLTHTVLRTVRRLYLAKLSPLLGRYPCMCKQEPSCAVQNQLNVNTRPQGSKGGGSLLHGRRLTCTTDELRIGGSDELREGDGAGERATKARRSFAGSEHLQTDHGEAARRHPPASSAAYAAWHVRHCTVPAGLPAPTGTPCARRRYKILHRTCTRSENGRAYAPRPFGHRAVQFMPPESSRRSTHALLYYSSCRRSILSADDKLIMMVPVVVPK